MASTAVDTIPTPVRITTSVGISKVFIFFRTSIPPTSGIFKSSSRTSYSSFSRRSFALRLLSAPVTSKPSSESVVIRTSLKFFSSSAINILTGEFFIMLKV